jgi:hypothetical protein
MWLGCRRKTMYREFRWGNMLKKKEPGYLISWTAQSMNMGSNPGRGKKYSLFQSILGTTHPPVQRLPQSFCRD